MCTICKLKVGDKVKWNKVQSTSDSWNNYYGDNDIFTVKSIDHNLGWFSQRYKIAYNTPGCFIRFQERNFGQGWDSTELIKIQTKQLKLKLP